MKDNLHRNCERIETVSKQAQLAEELRGKIKWIIAHLRLGFQDSERVKRMLENLNKQDQSTKVLRKMKKQVDEMLQRCK